MSHFKTLFVLTCLIIPSATSEHILIADYIPRFPISYIEAPAAATSPALVSHAEETWLSALEWCESRGNPLAINPMDSDGTPSYYSFQFKPGTFRWLGEKYELISKGQSDIAIMSLMKETELQRQIVRRMIKDTDINIANQFPDCVLHKIGFPPA